MRMQIIGLHGKSGSGKTTVSVMVARELLERGYTVKLDSFVQVLRERARDTFGDVGKESVRAWLQRAASSIREENRNYFINELLVRNNMDASMWKHFSDKWEPANFLIIHDVRNQTEVEFCRRHGVVVHLQGTHRPLTGAAAIHETEGFGGSLFYGADYIIARQPSLSRLAAAVRAMVETGGHLKKPDAGESTDEKGK